MHQALKRQLFVVLAATLVAAIGTSVASAAASHGRFGRFTARSAFQHGGFGPSFGGFAGPGGGGGLGFFAGHGGPGDGQGFGGLGIGGPGSDQGGPGGPGGDASILGSDVLTPAASFLGISVSTLGADLKSGKTLAQEAVAKGKTADALVTAVTAAEKTVLDAENAAGWITDSQETSLLARLTTQITDLVNNGPPVPPAAKGPGLLDTASTYLGVSVSDLQADLQSGKSLASVATAQGKSVDGLVAALVAVTQTNLDAQVTAGTITQAQEGTIIAKVTTQLTDLVNNTQPTPSSQSNTKLMRLYRK